MHHFVAVGPGTTMKSAITSAITELTMASAQDLKEYSTSDLQDKFDQLLDKQLQIQAQIMEEQSQQIQILQSEIQQMQKLQESALKSHFTQLENEIFQELVLEKLNEQI